MDTIRTEKLTRSFGPVTALDSLSIAVKPGEIFGLVGPDGAGKTTTMRLLTGIMEPTSGDAWVNGLHIVRDSDAIKHEIGYMSQRFGLYPDLTVMENIEFYADIYREPGKGRQEKIERLLAFSNMTGFKTRLAGNLSGGMKQKLGICCALIHTPRVLFLDEPTNGVDPVSRRDFWRILYSLLKDEVTIFVATSYLDEAERCSRLALINNGRLMACGTPAEIKGLLKDTILEIHTPSARQAAAVLKRELHGGVAIYGSSIHLNTAEPVEALKRAKAVLASAGISVTAAKEIEPSLEDVFTSVLAVRQGGDGDAGK